VRAAPAEATATAAGSGGGGAAGAPPATSLAALGHPARRLRTQVTARESSDEPGQPPVGGTVRITCQLDGRKSRAGFRHGTRPEQAISCSTPVQVHGPRHKWKRKADHEVLLGSLCTVKPWTLRPACTSVTLGTLQNAACQLHTLWLRPAVLTMDSIHIR